MNNETEIDYIVKACTMKLTSITGNFENLWVNEPLLPTDVFDDADNPVSCTDTADVHAIVSQIGLLLQNLFVPDTENERENKVKYGGSAFQLTTQMDAQTFQTAKLI